VTKIVLGLSKFARETAGRDYTRENAPCGKIACVTSSRFARLIPFLVLLTAALAGLVRRLWVDADRTEPGHIDESTGEIAPAGGDEDVLDELAALVIRRAGDVYVVPEASRLPAHASLIAELR